MANLEEVRKERQARLYRKIKEGLDERAIALHFKVDSFAGGNRALHQEIQRLVNFVSRELEALMWSS